MSSCEQCWYYSRIREIIKCGYDGHLISYPFRICDHFTLSYVIKESPVRSCHECIWRSYPASVIMCDHPEARKQMRDNPKFVTPCQYFEYDETGQECYVRKAEGYEFILTERKLRKKKSACSDPNIDKIMALQKTCR